ncbi:MAG: hypothetical protein H6Q43_934 [Deltaproteobacteria bacterium]|nr:hypothetical protein [Deltaproteobacteria bacterium]
MEIGPKLEPPHQPVLFPFRHFLVNDPAARGHPLDVPRLNDPLISHAVPMFHLSMKDIRDCLNPAVGMPREALQVVSRVVGMKIIKKKKRIQHGNMLIAKGSFQMNPGALDGRLAFENLFDLSDFCHSILLFKRHSFYLPPNIPMHKYGAFCILRFKIHYFWKIAVQYVGEKDRGK